MPMRLAEWTYPIHEIMLRAYPVAGLAPDQFLYKHERTPALVYKHHHKPFAMTRRTKRNLRICKFWEATANETLIAPVYSKDPRFQYYYAQSLHQAGELAAAIERYKLALSLFAHGDEYRFQIHNQMMLAGADAVTSAQAMIAERPTWPAGHFALARAWWTKIEAMLVSQDWTHFLTTVQLCIDEIRTGLALPTPTTLLWNNANEKVAIHDIYNRALNYAGDVAGAIASCEKGQENGPVPVLANNIILYSAFLAKERLVAARRDLASFAGKGVAGADELAAQYLTQTRESAVSLAKGGKTRIAFVLGEQWEPWNPDTGAPGGSENAVIDISSRLAKRGYEVLVYSGSSVQMPTVFDGVLYTGRPRPTQDETFDVMIGWRAFDRLSLGQAEQRLLWIHDNKIAPGPELARVTTAVCLTPWHVSEMRPSLGHVPIIFIPHGVKRVEFDAIDRARVERKAAPRLMNKAVWTSSFDRGLETVLKIWPQIRGVVPNARLDIMYGLDGSLNIAKKTSNLRLIERIEKCRATILSLADQGVTLCGRVPRAEQLERLFSAGVWIYPSWTGEAPFYETNCVSAIEALSAGLRVVCSLRGGSSRSRNTPGRKCQATPIRRSTNGGSSARRSRR